MSAQEFRLPVWLLDFVRAEQPEFAPEAVTRQLRAAGVIELVALGDDPTRPAGIAYVQPDNVGGWVDVLYDEWGAPDHNGPGGAGEQPLTASPPRTDALRVD